MVDIFDGLTPEELGIKHVSAEVVEARSRLADQVCDELRKAGLRACLGTIDDPSPGAKIEVESFEDGPAASVYWKCAPSVHGAFDTSRPDGGPSSSTSCRRQVMCRQPCLRFSALLGSPWNETTRIRSPC